MHGPAVARFRAAIVGDESPSRQLVRELLEDAPDVEIVAEHSGGRNAVRLLSEELPNLIVIDIEMPQMTGFDVVSKLPVTADYQPVVVFTTASESSAARAFDTRAVDCLLKPFDRKRFQMALERARLHQRGFAASSTGVAEMPNYLKRLAVRTERRLTVLRISDVDYIAAEGNYVRLHIRKESYLHRTAISELERRLDPSQFVRIHRSTIVNVERIASIDPAFHRDLLVTLCDGTRLRMSATHRSRLETVITGV